MNPFLMDEMKGQKEKNEVDIHICVNSGHVNIEMAGEPAGLLAAICEALRRLEEAGVSRVLIHDAVSMALWL